MFGIVESMNLKHGVIPLVVMGVALIILPVQVHSQAPSEDLAQLAPEQTGPDTFYKARVVEVTNTKDEENLGIAGADAFTQDVRVQILDGDKKGVQAQLPYGGLSRDQLLKVGETIVIVKPGTNNGSLYVFDRYRLPPLFVLLALFVLIAVLLAGWRAVTSIAGLGVSIAVLGFFIIPRILAGSNPFWVISVGAIGISIVSLYLAHGFSKRTTVALASTLVTVVCAMVFSIWAVRITHLFGVGSEEAFYLQSGILSGIDLRGLLLGGIVIGLLGVLDDVTTAQVAAVDEIAKANPLLSAKELYKRGLSVGKEHITSLINTLALAYAGTAFPALLLFVIYERPAWVVLNTEAVAEEVVRTLVGSIVLIAAVPLATYLATKFLIDKRVSSSTP